ncbi:MAG: DUF4032 domain-containing protein [Gammaproteobacteria bacterium]
MKLQIASPGEFPAGLDLPWRDPLESWEHPALVRLTRGISRNIVRFAAYRDAVYAIKELDERLAEREYGLLRELVELGLPVVEPVCLVTERTTPGAAGRGLLVTRYLDHSVPLRSLISGGASAEQASKLMDAVGDLLVRLHLAGFFWGDCSLSNTLFRLDAGRFAAYLVDAETGEIHPSLSDGQRFHDLMIASENLAGELMDLEQGFGLPPGVEPVALAGTLAPRYEHLWEEIHRVETYPENRQDLLEDRLHQLNAMGFDIEEMEIEALADGRLRVRPRPNEGGYHRRLVQRLMGLDAQENQARRLLTDMYAYRAWRTGAEGKDIPVAVSAHRWFTDVYQPTLDAIPAKQREKLDDPEIFHQILEHRWYMSEREGRELGLEDVIPSYVAQVLEPMAAPRVEPSPLAGASE